MALANHFNAIPSSISSPSRKDFPKSVSGYGREEVDRNWTRNVSEDEMWTLLGYSKDVYVKKYENAPTKRSIEKEEQIRQGQDRSVYCKLLNRISEHVRDNLEQPVTEIMKFVDLLPKALVGHPIAAGNCPDFIAVSLPMDLEYTTCPRWHWSDLEMTGRITSNGKDDSTSYIRAASCTGYLLQSRPDRTAVLGISVDQEKFRLIIARITNRCHSGNPYGIEWPTLNSAPLPEVEHYVDSGFPAEILWQVLELDGQSEWEWPASRGFCDVIFTNVFGIFHMLPIDWHAPYSGPLLCAWLSRLYAPSFDESVKQVKSPDGPTFIITVNPGNKETVYSGCFIYGVGGPFHRRTIVLMDCKREAAIKEQYNEVGQWFKEGYILDVIHAHKTFPGVVQKVSYDVVQSGTQDLMVENAGVKREKTRLVMFDKGGPLMDAETPLEALIAFYDLLEVTRFLYTKRGVLHRDISSGNVLLRTGFPSGGNSSEDLGEMCFASFLLKEKAPHLKSALLTTRLPKPSDLALRVARLDTRVLLIDFDMSEIHNEALNTIGKPMQQAGTPIFMARIVRSCMYPGGVCDIPAMPPLEEGKARYEQCVGARLAAFPDNNGKILRAKKDRDLPFFLHKLRYDAESVFWLLLYWCMLAKPEKDPLPQEIPSNIWEHLTSVSETRDDRNANFVTEFPTKLCHSAYAPLDRLLGDMAAQLRGDPDFFNENLQLAEGPFKGVAADSPGNSSRLDEEYLHEAFQRLLLNFLFKHYDAEFMRETKSKSYRELEDNGRGALPLSNQDRQRRYSNQMSRKRKAGDGSGEMGDGSNDASRDKRIRLDETPVDVSQMLA